MLTLNIAAVLPLGALWWLMPSAAMVVYSTEGVF
jgi:hypothetical protein